MARISRMTRKRLGEILLSEGLVTQEQIAEGLDVQKKTGNILGETLIDLGFVDENDVARVVARQYGVPFIDPSQYHAAPEALDIFPLAALKKYCFVPLDLFGDSVVIVINGVLEAEVIEEIERIAGRKVHVLVGTVSAVRDAIDALDEDQPESLTTLGSMLLGMGDEAEGSAEDETAGSTESTDSAESGKTE